MVEKVEIEGVIREIIYYNKENFYAVSVIGFSDEEIVMVGNIPNISVGKTYKVEGTFTEHIKYGVQLKVSNFEEVEPSDIYSIEAFLSSGVLKGIGPALAKSIVDKFKEDTLNIILEKPDELLKIRGIGKSKAKQINEAYKVHKEYAKILMLLKPLGISADTGIKIYETLGEEALEIIKKNPYILIGEAFGIGFKKADKIASKIGIAKENEDRIKSGILYMLNGAVREGHCYLPEEELCNRTEELLEVSTEEIADTIIKMAFEGKINVDIIENRKVIYLYEYYKAERFVTEKIISMCQYPLKEMALNISDMIRQTEKDLNIIFSDKQKKAIKNCLSSAVSVITGGPGTGKTTIINGVINILKCNSFKTAICAPTGRAAKRITETTGEDASTIHRLLEYKRDDASGIMYFGKNEEETLEYDAIIVDEASMMDLMLTNGLLKAIKDGTRLILVGDADQLPSVGAGNVLGDIIKSEYICCERLNEIFRQAQESMIVVNAHRINRGENLISNTKDSDFFFSTCVSEAKALSRILEFCDRRLVDYYKFKNKLSDIQVLTPKKKGLLGTVELNKKLQSVLNPATEFLVEKEFFGTLFRENDKVMQIKNNYDMKWTCSDTMVTGDGVFNGDIGFIHRIDEGEQKVTVVFDGNKYAEYEYQQMEELELAYAITIHKSQGSEFPAVIIPISWLPYSLANRNLLYTGVTRGKKVVVLVGDEKYADAMIQNNNVKYRYSGLAIRIKSIYEEQNNI